MELPSCFLCPVCYHGFDTQPPLIAPCGHAACIRCVKNLSECPVCRAPPDRWWPCSNLQEGAKHFVKMLMEHKPREDTVRDLDVTQLPASGALMQAHPDAMIKFGKIPRTLAKLDADRVALNEPNPLTDLASADLLLERSMAARGMVNQPLMDVLKFLRAAAQSLMNPPSNAHGSNSREMELRILAETASVFDSWPAHVERSTSELMRFLSFLPDIFVLQAIQSGPEPGKMMVKLMDETPEQKTNVLNFIQTDHPCQEMFAAKLEEALQEIMWRRHSDGSTSSLCQGDVYNLTIALLESAETQKLELREIRNALQLAIGLNEFYAMLKRMNLTFMVRHQGGLFESMEDLQRALNLDFGIDISGAGSRNPVVVYVLAPSVAGIWGSARS